MTFLPIVERELRVAARRKGTHWLWLSAALLAMAAVFIVVLGSQRSASPQSLGKWVFHIVSGMAFTFGLLAGVFLTSDCLCSEKRDGTLGLLFLTDLKGYDVVLGKLAATSIVSVYALLAVIPMLGLPLVMGGVSFGEFGRMTLALVGTLFLSLATGMLASAMSQETRSAMMASFGVMLGLTAGVFGVSWAVYHVFNWKPVEYLALLSPLGAFMFSHEPQYNIGWSATGYWISLGLVFALGLGQLIAACLVLPRGWQASGLEVSRRSETGRAHRAVADGNPFQWLLERDAFPGPLTRVIASLLFLIWLCFLAATFLVGRADQHEMMMASFAATIALHVIGKSLLAVQASRRFSEDRRSGALELLLTTPIQVGTILTAQRTVLKCQFQWFQTALLGANLGLIATLIFVVGRQSNDWEPAAVLSTVCVGGSVLWLVDTRALTWLAMWMGLRGSRHHRAVLNSLSRILAPPWLAFGLFIFLTHGASSAWQVLAYWSLWFVFSILSALLAVKHRRRELLEDFRRLAAGDKKHTAFDALQPWSPGWKAAVFTRPAA